jgi:RNA polymerase subunit RPABC4/transcription elongation factor Spt4
MVLAALAAVVVGVLLASTLVGVSAPVPRGAAPALGPHPAVMPAVTHGDLVVGSGETFNITTPANGSSTYYQGGNITVDSGGTLILHSVTLSFVEFVGSLGTPQERLSHIYHFLVNAGGTVKMNNSTITTDLITLSTYGKLNLTVAGTMSLLNSALAFAGWVRVTGATANLTLTNSVIEGNPQFPGLLSSHQTGLNETFVGDTGYAPTLNASAGGQVSLFASKVASIYQNNLSKNGTPAPLPLLNNSSEAITTAVNLTHFATPTDSTSVTQDLLYANEIAGGTVTFAYTATVGGTVGITVDYGGHAYSLGTVPVTATTSVASLPFSALLTKAINSQGAEAYLNYTGDFGVTPSKIAVSVASTTATGTMSDVSVQLNPAVSYNLTVTGAGSKLNVVDSSVDLSFYAPINYWWFSHKLELSGGATAFLANLSVPNSIPTVNASAAIVADNASTATLFRWASFNLTGKGGVLELQGGVATPYYAYGTTQANNATVNADNNLATSDPAIAGYLKVWDKLNHRPNYGESGFIGVASLLVATNQIGGTTGPDGDFLGDYNISVTAPTDTGTTAKQTVYWGGVTPYPEGVAFGTSGYQLTDFGPSFIFPQYSVKFQVTAVTVLANGNPDDTVKVGQTLGVQVTVKTLGAGPIDNLAATLFYNSTEGTILAGATPVPPNMTLTVNPTVTFVLSWVVTTTVTGKHSGSFGNTFWLLLVWNNNSAKHGGSEYQQGVQATIAPASTSPLGFLGQKFLGLPIWIWLVIAAAIVVAVVVLLFFFRRQAGGKLVECGECGNLIPELATSCPKCGAEFETDVVRCSRCSSTIPASSKFCPDCAVQLLGKPGEEALDPERQAYADFTERYRAEAKKALGDNYAEGAFWDWWKRQSSYLPYGQWRLQQGQGTPRTRATAPPPGPAGSGPGGAPARAAARPPPAAAGRPPARPPPGGAGAAPAAPPPAPETGAEAPAAPGGNLKACPNCSKEIPADYLVCPFCGSVTQ